MPDCGHSICSKCMSQTGSEFLTCPTCGKKQNCSKTGSCTSRSKTKKAIPDKASGGKVLEMEMEKSSESEEESDEDNEEDSALEAQSLSSINKSENLCPLHFKNFDGYCLSCNMLICIDCIFEKHKTHDFHQLEKARERASNDMTKMKLRIEGMRDDCLQRLKFATSAQTDMGAGLEQRMIELKTVMNELRRYIMTREQKLEEQIKREFEKCKEDNMANIQLLEKESLKISSLLSAISFNLVQDDMRFLGKA